MIDECYKPNIHKFKFMTINALIRHTFGSSLDSSSGLTNNSGEPETCLKGAKLYVLEKERQKRKETILHMLKRGEKDKDR